MPFESFPLVHWNQVEEFEYERQVEGYVQVQKECYFDDEPMCLDELLRDDLITHIPSLEHVETFCEDRSVNDELLFLNKIFEIEFNEFCERMFVEKHKISSNHVE